MTAVAQGSSVNVTISSGKAIAVTGVGSYAIGTGAQQLLPGLNAVPIGPFNGDRVVTLTALGTALDYLDAAPGQPLFVVSASAPNNADGRPDGTIYIQSAT